MSGHRRWVCRECGRGIGGHAYDCRTGELSKAARKLQASEAAAEILRQPEDPGEDGDG